METNKNQEVKEKSKFPIMLVITLVYLIMIILFILIDVDGMKRLKPNEWGDFFAGFFAPLVFLWLIFGYYQQGKELQQNTKALNLQAEELRNSVEQQEELVKATREELELIKNQHLEQYKKELVLRQPYFHSNGSNIATTESISIWREDDIEQKDKEIRIQFDFTNSRSIARDVRVSVSEQNRGIISGEVINFFKSGEVKSIFFNLPYPDCFIDGKIEGLINFSYLDELDERQRQSFKYLINKEKIDKVYPRQLYLYDKSY